MSGAGEPVKCYEVEGLTFEFSPNGSPLSGVLAVVCHDRGTYTADVNLTKSRSRQGFAREAAEDYGFDAGTLRRALNEICTLRMEEVARAAEGKDTENEPREREPLSEEADALIATPGVLARYVEDAARIRGVVGDREPLRLQTLVAVGAQLAPLPSGRPAGANLILTAEAGRGKNYISDAATVGLPEEFFLAFESASAKSLYYRAENDPEILKNRFLYPNEAEGVDHLVEFARPMLSGGKASHLTVNKTGEGRNAAQELTVEGPISITIPTVRNKLDTQLQTRMLVAELPDYSGRVAAHSRAVSRQLLPDQAGEDHSPKVAAWQEALRSLTQVRRVVFPLDAHEFCFDSDTVSHGARLWTNLLGLMLAHAWLEQRNRDIRELASGEMVVVATPDDYGAAYAIFEATCERSVVNLSDTHRAILDAVYDLSSQGAFDGFSLRKIADKAGVHHSTVAEHKTYLTKSAKLLKEVEGGLDLVSDAEPSWWRKDDLLVGFPRPEQVRRWWQEVGCSPPESARQTRQPAGGDHNPDTYAESPGGHPTRQPANATRQPRPMREGEGVSSAVGAASRAGTDTENRVGEPKTEGNGPVSGVSGGFGKEADNRVVCIHDVNPGACKVCNGYARRLIEGQERGAE